MNTTRDLDVLSRGASVALRHQDLERWWRTMPPAKARIRRMYAAQSSARANPADPRAMRSVAETAYFQANLRNCATCPFRGVLRTVARDSGVCLRALGCDPALRGRLGICMQQSVY